MNNNKIINGRTPTTKDNAANKEYVDIKISEADNKNKQVIDMSKKTSANLHINNKNIINLNEPQPYNSYYAANVNNNNNNNNNNTNTNNNNNNNNDDNFINVSKGVAEEKSPLY